MSDPVCPYCRTGFDESTPPRLFCNGCGTPHHEDCYQENGGCTVFGCRCAPADDPKLQVSQADLQAPAPPQVSPQNVPALPSPYAGPLGLNQPAPAVPAAAPAQPAPPRQQGSSMVPPPPLPPGARPQPYYVQAYVYQGPPKNRTTFILLGVFLGALGIHNFYAGYTGRAVGQLCLTIMTLFYGGIISWIWAVVEVCIVEQDSAGRRFV